MVLTQMSRSLLVQKPTSVVCFVTNALLTNIRSAVSSCVVCLQLADTKMGVIGLRARPVPCDYKPEKVAPSLSNPTPGIPPPPGQTDPYAGKGIKDTSGSPVTYSDAWLNALGYDTVTQGSTTSSSSSQAPPAAPPPSNNNPSSPDTSGSGSPADVLTNYLQSTSSGSGSTAPSRGPSVTAYDDGLTNGFYDASWNVQVSMHVG